MPTPGVVLMVWFGVFVLLSVGPEGSLRQRIVPWYTSVSFLLLGLAATSYCIVFALRGEVVRPHHTYLENGVGTFLLMLAAELMLPVLALVLGVRGLFTLLRQERGG